MLEIKNLTAKLTAENKTIIKNINLTVRDGEVHILNGNNGSGKSTLVNVIMGNPEFSVIEGEIKLKNEKFTKYELQYLLENKIDQNDLDLLKLEPDKRSRLGIYLATQYPVAIPGVSLASFLRLIFNLRLPKEKKLPVFKFRELLKEKAALINYPESLLKRNLNDGFSGGEKKKTEILQILLLKPKYVLLDEIDSGLDKNAVKDVFEGLKLFKTENPKTGFVIITHYDKTQEYLEPTHTHEMKDGMII